MLSIPAIITPISHESWTVINYGWQFFPVFTAVQWLTDWYPQGKTSVESRFNINGKIAWALMECPGVLTVLYLMLTLPTHLRLSNGLPVGNWTMATLYTAHYIYRAFAFPFLNPSMSPIHPLVALSAFAWQVTNGICIGGWLGGYGPTSVHDWAGHASFAIVGLIVWGWGFLGNMYHDDELREIRRKAMKKGEAEQKEKDATSAGKKGEKVDIKKFYDVPRAGLFRYVLYPHYLCEWIEWGGFWMLGGWSCMPARSFLLNEISTMLPRALSGKRWYIERFGEERVGKGKKAVIPGLL